MIDNTETLVTMKKKKKKYTKIWTRSIYTTATTAIVETVLVGEKQNPWYDYVSAIEIVGSKWYKYNNDSDLRRW